MITIKYYLDKRSKKIDNTYPLKIAITKGRSSSYIPLGICLTDEQWNNKTMTIVKHPKKQFFNTFIVKRKLEIEEIILKLIQNKEAGGSVTEVKNKILSFLQPEKEETTTDIFDYWIDKFIDNKNGRTKEIYQATKNRIKEFSSKEYPKLRFGMINLDWLTKFDNHLAKTSPAKNARNIHLRNIRAIFNFALDNDMKINYPFRKFKMKYEATRKRSMPIEVLRKIINSPISDYLERYRDFFMLSFLLIGINVIDICNLKEISDGRIVYKRAKTHKLYSIKLEPEAEAIIKKYAGENYLLYYLDHFKSYRVFYNALYRGLHSLKDELNIIKDDISIPEITTYWARHTWATIASDLDIPNETIAAALGHSYGNSTSAIYIDFNSTKVDAANRKVIDWVLYNKK